MKDFFISYNKADKAWAEWIAWTLEEAGYSVEIQAWDFRPGENFALKMHEAAAGTRKTIAVLSQNYLDARFTQPEWAAAFARDPEGEERILIPIRVGDCLLEGLKASIIFIDVVGLSEEEARKAILDGIKERAKPGEAPGFPGLSENKAPSTSERVAPDPVRFPGSSDSNEAPASQILWNVPEGVPLFTGREDVLDQLHKALMATGSTALAQRQAISGLGGIGKTQTAIEYASRHRGEYKAVLWAVAESRETLISGFTAIASVLDLPVKNIQDQTLVVSTVKRWLELNTDWLLILDNADEPRLLEDFLPSAPKGHIILTSRAQVFDSVGIFNPIELEEMSPEDAKKFLLMRTGRHDLEADENEAVEQLAHKLDYLPLALEQAGAYIKQLRSSFRDYLASYNKRGLELLEKGTAPGNYGKSVRTTWSLNFQQVEEVSKASADVLRVSAFLSPDRIPNELIGMGAAELGPELSSQLANVETDPLVFDEVLNPLIQYSLIHRDLNSSTYDIHRLVQAVLKEGMNNEARQLWIERTVNAIARVLPEVDIDEPSSWDEIERILPHAQICSELIESWSIESLEAALVLNNLGRYLHFRARLDEAGVLYNRSLIIREKLLGDENADVATSIHNLGWLYFDQGRYFEAEQFYISSISIREKALDADHPDMATSLYQLARLYIEMGRYDEAEPLLNRTLKIREKIFGPENTKVAEIYDEQACIFYDLNEYIEAEKLVKKSLEITEKLLGPEHDNMGRVLGFLGSIYKNTNRFAEAENLYLRSRSIIETVFGTDYPGVAVDLNNLANLYIEMGRYDEAEPLLTRALEITEKAFGREHPDLAFRLTSLAGLYQRLGRPQEVEALYNEALKIRENRLGTEHYLVADNLSNLAALYSDQRKLSIGEPLVRRALSIYKKTLGPEHPRVVDAMTIRAGILRKMGKVRDAQRIEAQVKKIRTKQHRKGKKKTR